MNDLKLEKVVYKYKDKEVALKVDYSNKEIYLTAKDMSILFDKAESNIRITIKELKTAQSMKNDSVHINFIHTEYKIELTADDGKTYKTNIYNSKVIYALGLKYKSEIIIDLKEFVDNLFKENNDCSIGNLSLNDANYTNYKQLTFSDGKYKINVNVSPNEHTIWLTQEQIAELFERDVSVISKHIKNILETGECDSSNLQKMQFALSTKPIILYDFDIFLSVGFRVKSKRGLLFRKWARSILKDYTFIGSSINDKRCLECRESIIALNNRVLALEKANNNYKDILFGNDYEYVSEGDIPKSIRDFDRIVKLSKNNIKIIDQYIDMDSIHFLEQYPPNKKFILFTSNKYLKDVELKDNISIIFGCKLHSRYIFVNDKYAYAYTCSLNSLDKNSYEIIFLDGLTIEGILKSYNK